jgi:hypothetical protein
LAQTIGYQRMIIRCGRRKHQLHTI